MTIANPAVDKPFAAGPDGAPKARLRVVVIGLSITSSWGNGHATTYRGLVRELVRRGHDVLFLEHDKPRYASNRDMARPPFGRTELYASVAELKDRFTADVRSADLVVVGSYVPEGVAVGEWATATARGGDGVYDIDTPVTLAKLERGDTEHLSPELIPKYGMYLSFTGGPTLRRLEREFGSPRALPLYCAVDPELYHPEEGVERRWEMGYLGTYSSDRQLPLEKLMLELARRWAEGRFAVAGPQYPASVRWPANVRRIEHLPPAEHRRFDNEQAFTLNIMRADMIRAGYSPSVRLFEAAARGVPIVSDQWEGLGTFFELGSEILVADSAADVLGALTRRRGGAGRDRRTGPAARAQERTLREEIDALGPWFHNLHLPDGTQTCPDHWLGDFPSFKWRQIASHLPENLTSWSCLDIGCNAGFYSFELVKRGATVLGIDLDERYLAQSRWAARRLGLSPAVTFEQMQVYDLPHRLPAEQKFDLALFMGVLYHLRYPMLGLDLVAQRVRRWMVFQTLTMPGDAVHDKTDGHGFEDRQVLQEPGWPVVAFLEHPLAGDPTNWWAPNHAAAEAMLRAAGMKVVQRPAHEIYFCEPDPQNPSAVTTWDVAELLSATGRPCR